MCAPLGARDLGWSGRREGGRSGQQAVSLPPYTRAQPQAPRSLDGALALRSLAVRTRATVKATLSLSFLIYKTGLG